MHHQYPSIIHIYLFRFVILFYWIETKMRQNFRVLLITNYSFRSVVYFSTYFVYITPFPYIMTYDNIWMRILYIYKVAAKSLETKVFLFFLFEETKYGSSND